MMGDMVISKFRKTLSALIVAVGVSQISGAALADRATTDLKPISVDIEASFDDFTLIDARMTETATAAVLFGVIGAGINSGINADQDRKKAAHYVPTAQEIDLAEILQSSILSVLEKRGYASQSGSDFNLSLEVKRWGLSRTSFEDSNFAPFLVIDVELADGRELKWEERMKESATDTYALPDMTPELFDQEMRALTVKTGKRIAYEILYP